MAHLTAGSATVSAVCCRLCPACVCLFCSALSVYLVHTTLSDSPQPGTRAVPEAVNDSANAECWVPECKAGQRQSARICRGSSGQTTTDNWCRVSAKYWQSLLGNLGSATICMHSLTAAYSRTAKPAANHLSSVCSSVSLALPSLLSFCVFLQSVHLIAIPSYCDPSCAVLLEFGCREYTPALAVFICAGRTCLFFSLFLPCSRRSNAFFPVVELLTRTFHSLRLLSWFHPPLLPLQFRPSSVISYILAIPTFYFPSSQKLFLGLDITLQPRLCTTTTSAKGKSQYHHHFEEHRRGACDILRRLFYTTDRWIIESI